MKIQDGSAFLTLTELRGNGADQCGYKCITRPNVNQSICVYALSTTHNTSNQQETPEDTVVTYTVNNVSKVMLLQLAVQSVRRNVVEIAETSDINANGLVESIREWA